jgi:hypothetical protein
MSTRTAPEVRYTERDVRENEELRELAESYVRNYGGEFDPLLRAFNMLSMDGALTTAMTRTVLNCMRHDENVASILPEPKGYTMSDRLTPRQPKQRKREPRMIRLQLFKLNYDYVVNLHPQAKWYHQIDHTRTLAYWYPLDWPNQAIRNSIELREVRAMCGKDLNAYWWNRRRHIVLADKIDAEDSGNQFCPRCKYGHRDAGWKP